MGIRGLFTMIENNTRSYDIYDLVKRRNNESAIEILVDFNSFQRDLVEIISIKISKEYDNNNLLFPSGEYDIFKKATSEFHTVFKNAGINLIWIMDGPKGLDKVASAWKKDTWMQRDKDDIKNLNNILDAAKLKSYPKNLNNLGPLFSFSICIEGLKAVGAEMIQLLQGGSDEFIVSEYRKRKSFAIISNDTDYLVFPGLKVIFSRLMPVKYGNDKMNLPFIDKIIPGNIFTNFDKFECPIVTQNGILQILELSDPSQLITLCIIKGNDNTEEYAQNLQYSLGITKYEGRNAHVTHVAKFITKQRVTEQNILKLPKMQNFLEIYPSIKEAIKFCYKFYTLKYFEENDQNSLVTYDPTLTNDLTLTGYFQMKLSKFQIPLHIYSMHCGVFHEPILPERVNSTCLSITTIMADIRSKLYPYILDEKHNEVVEWRPHGYPQEIKIPVKHAEFKTNEIKGKPEQGMEQSDSIIYGMDLFEDVWSHLESEGSLKYFRKFDFKRGFICYILRYFYKITKNKNLNISTDEFRALFITVFYQHGISEGKIFKTKIKRETFLGLNICPTEKCLITFSWFMNVYFTGRYLSWAALNLQIDFPVEDKVINGSSFYAFYESILNDMNKRTSHLDDSIQDSIESLGIEIMEHYHEEYTSVTNA